ncbi:MAG: hypothetical protein QG621_704 [Patescibacteria group bacterium]|jgi:hypothetical protein|nr:hypothetical protein [Patescibacteria group bacterium]
MKPAQRAIKNSSPYNKTLKKAVGGQRAKPASNKKRRTKRSKQVPLITTLLELLAKEYAALGTNLLPTMNDARQVGIPQTKLRSVFGTLYEPAYHFLVSIRHLILGTTVGNLMVALYPLAPKKIASLAVFPNESQVLGSRVAGRLRGLKR